VKWLNKGSLLEHEINESAWNVALSICSGLLVLNPRDQVLIRMFQVKVQARKDLEECTKTPCFDHSKQFVSA
jgi:hypothetical protein